MRGLPQFELPPMKFEPVMQSFSEIYDWGLLDLNVPDAHKKTQGENIKICIIDSGKPDHFEVINNVADAVNFTDEDNEKDFNSHSTFISGIIAAEKNMQGIIGVAPKAKLYLAKALDNAGRGDPSYTTKSVKWAIEKNVDIISISAGMFFDFKPLRKQIKKAYAKNITIVAATGNTGKNHYDVAFPARYKEVIGVAAYDKKRKTANFSSRGINVAFAMPGVDVYSCGLNNGYMKSSGTSFACPIMTGLCALILARHRQPGHRPNTPCDTPKEIMEHLIKYSIELNAETETGFGTIDLAGVLR